MRHTLRVAISVLWLLPVSAIATPILYTDSSGQLLGATNVDVDGSLYTVEFAEGDCVTLFDGCSESAFTFSSRSAALAASAALLAQVFTDIGINGQGNFDSFPFLTNGCTSVSLCAALTPYELGFGVRYAIAENSWFEGFDQLSTAESGFTLDRDDTVWTVWTAIPEPSSLSLLALGLLLTGFSRRPSRARSQD